MHFVMRLYLRLTYILEMSLRMDLIKASIDQLRKLKNYHPQNRKS